MRAETYRRYGPEPASRVIGDRRVRLVFTAEGGGSVATCLGCGWLRWGESVEDLQKALRRGKVHEKCPAKKGTR